MRDLATPPALTPIALAASVTALAFPPVAGNIAVVSAWEQPLLTRGSFDLDVWGTSSFAVTLAELFAGKTHPFTIAGKTFTVVFGTGVVTSTAHGLVTGDGPFQLTNSGGALPAGLAVLTNFWFIKIDADTGYFASSLALALAGTHVTFTGNGTGTQTLTGTAANARVTWHSVGLLGNKADGAITLTASQGYAIRCKHHPLAIAYAVAATFTGTLSINVTPSSEV